MSFIHIPKSQFSQLFRSSGRNEGYGAATVGGLACSIFNNTPSGSVNNDTFIGQIRSPGWAAGIKIYKGTLPSAAQFDAFPGINNVAYQGTSYNYDWFSSTRESDILVRLGIKTGGSNASIENNSIVINLNAAVASASGTASWFFFKVGPTGEYSWGASASYGFIGTIGAVGSGADLELNTTTVTAGQSVRLDTIKIPYQTKLTW